MVAILLKIIKVILEIKKVAGFLRALRSGDLVRSYIKSYVLGAIADSMIQNGVSPQIAEAVRGGPAKAFEGTVFGEFLNPDLPGLAESWVNGALVDAGIDPAGLEFDIGSHIDNLLSGKSVGNSRSPVRNPARGSPVNLARGEFHWEAVDLEVAGAGIDFQFRRTYGSAVAFYGKLGPGWDHSANMRLVQTSPYTISRLTGSLSEQMFVQHPNYGQGSFNYYIPPNGVHDVIVEDGAGSYKLLKPGGVVHQYEATVQAGHHRIKTIHDRFGNFLAFDYTTDDLLGRIRVNSLNDRYVRFEYDAQIQLLIAIEDHAGRRVEYGYDDWGSLAAVKGPTFPGERPAHSEYYEYDLIGDSLKLSRVFDAKGRLLVENDYERSKTSDWFGYLTRQLVNKGESYYVYERLATPPEDNRSFQDQPTLRVMHYQRNGHEIEHLLNDSGNELYRRERYLDGCSIREAVTRTRYNADGAIIATLNPEGVLTQTLYARDLHPEADSAPSTVHTLGDIKQEERMSFGNRLVTITRGEPRSFTDDTWINQHPARTSASVNAGDIIQKFTFDPATQLPLSISDPRHTVSPDPLHPESAPPGSPSYRPTSPEFLDHQRHLTSMVYDQASPFLLRKTCYPDRTWPAALDGRTGILNIQEQYIDYDPKGRLTKKIDPGGYEWMYEYFAGGVKDGFLRRQLSPHVDWSLGDARPDILEIERQGNWSQANRYVLSSGGFNDELRFSVEGVRVVLNQSTNPAEIVSADTQVTVLVDGNAQPPWDQTGAAEYVISGLSTGIHDIRIQGSGAGPIAVGRVRSHVAVEFDRDDLGNVIKETNARGFFATFVVDSLGRQESVTRGSGSSIITTEFEYDSDGNRTQERREWRDEAGAIRPERWVVKRSFFGAYQMPVSDTIGPEVGSGQRQTRYWYDVEDNLKHTKNSRNVSTRYGYDEMNRRIRTDRASCSPVATSTMVRYDAAGRIAAQWNARGAMSVNGYRDAYGNWQSGLDVRGLPRVQTDPLGHLRVRDYDARGGLITERLFQRRADASYELLSRADNEYDEQGGVARKVVSIFETPIKTASPVHAPDAEFQAERMAGRIMQATEEYFLDADGNVIASQRAEGGIERQQVDGQGRVYDSIDANGMRTFRIFDGNGNTVRTYRYDPVRDRSTGAIVRYEAFVEDAAFDDHNRETCRTDQYGNQWWRYYDSLGNVVSTVDPLGNILRYEYNAFGEQVAAIQERTASGIGGGPALAPYVTAREYDNAGNLAAILDARNVRAEFTYDALDRLIRTQFNAPTGPSEHRTYDTAGNLQTFTARSGLRKLMDYDLLDRNVRVSYDLTAVASSDLPSSISQTFALFEYDAASGTHAHENDFCRVEIHRDSRGLPIAERVAMAGIAGAPAAQTFRRSYDREGRRVLLGYPSGREVKYTFNSAGNITQIENVIAPQYPGRPQNSTGFTLALYGYAGQRPEWARYGNGSSQDLLYDGRGIELERLATTANGAVLWRQQRSRDCAGHVRLETAVTSSGVRTRGYGLDSLYRLTSFGDFPASWMNTGLSAPATAPVRPSPLAGQMNIDAAISAFPLFGNPPAYDYDAVGNRHVTQEPGRPVVTSVPDILNQYIQVGDNQWVYDTNGNQRKDELYAFEYDANDALSQISYQSTGNVLATCHRDALGRMIAESSGASARFRIYDGIEPIVELSGVNRTEYTPGSNGLAIHVASAGEDYWIVRDTVRSLRLLLDGAAGVVAMPDHGPYGPVASLLMPFTLADFAGMSPIANLPFLNSLKRVYRPDIGRYLQLDPIGFVDDVNLYAYVRNNPIEGFDPFGLSAKSDNLSSKAGFAVGEWGRFGEGVNKLIGKPYEMSTREHPKTGFVSNKTGELVGPGLACQGFVNAVISYYHSGTFTAQIPVPIPKDKNIFLEHGAVQINSQSSYDELGIDNLDQSLIYGMQSLDKQTRQQTHVWFLVYSEKMNAWVRLEASSVPSRMESGIFPLKKDEKHLFNMYVVGAKVNNTIDFSGDDPETLGLDIPDI